MNTNDQDIKNILTNYKHLVVYGLSPDATKPSQGVPLFLKSKGFSVVGIYPGKKEIAGFPIYASLKDVPAQYRKFVDVFRRSENVPEVIDEILAVGGVEVVWLQLGVSHAEAEKKAEAAGLKVVSNRCPHIEYERLF